jgi:hypothetical protein
VAVASGGPVQRRTIGVLLTTQIDFAVALAMAGPVAALLAQQLTGSATLAGLAQATTVTGGGRPDRGPPRACPIPSLRRSARRSDKAPARTASTPTTGPWPASPR